jgi:hypothetical protein
VKNVCDNQGGFTYLGYLGQHDKNRANPSCIASPKVAKAKLDIYGTTDSYATNVENADIYLKNVCDNQSGFTLGNMTKIEPMLDVFFHPRLPSQVVKLDSFSSPL